MPKSAFQGMYNAGNKIALRNGLFSAGLRLDIEDSVGPPPLPAADLNFVSDLVKNPDQWFGAGLNLEATDYNFENAPVTGKLPVAWGSALKKEWGSELPGESVPVDYMIKLVGELNKKVLAAGHDWNAYVAGMDAPLAADFLGTPPEKTTLAQSILLVDIVPGIWSVIVSKDLTIPAARTVNENAINAELNKIFNAPNGEIKKRLANKLAGMAAPAAAVLPGADPVSRLASMPVT